MLLPGSLIWLAPAVAARRRSRLSMTCGGCRLRAAAAQTRDRRCLRGIGAVGSACNLDRCSPRWRRLGSPISTISWMAPMVWPGEWPPSASVAAVLRRSQRAMSSSAAASLSITGAAAAFLVVQLSSCPHLHGRRGLRTARFSGCRDRHAGLALGCVAAVVPAARFLALHRRCDRHARAASAAAETRSGRRTRSTITSASCAWVSDIAARRSSSTWSCSPPAAAPSGLRSQDASVQIAVLAVWCVLYGLGMVAVDRRWKERGVCLNRGIRPPGSTSAPCSPCCTISRPRRVAWLPELLAAFQPRHPARVRVRTC